MRNLNTRVLRLPAGSGNTRRPIAVLLLLGLLLAASLAAMNVSAGAAGIQSSIVAADVLAAHGIELKPLPAGVAAATISVENARATAQERVGASKVPEETYRVLASDTYYHPKRTAWLFLFKGGPGPVSAGPPEGAESRTFSTDYTGVLVDDQTGEVLRWFQGGSFTP